jgi:hypothetical protein
MLAAWQGAWGQNLGVCCHSKVCPPVTPIIYKAMFTEDEFDIKNDEARVGVCIFLGGQRDQPAQYPDYNWEQITYAFTKDDRKVDKSCGADSRDNPVPMRTYDLRTDLEPVRVVRDMDDPCIASTQRALSEDQPLVPLPSEYKRFP